MTESNYTLGIFIFENVEVLDFCGPFEVFNICSTEHGPAPHAFTIKLIAESLDPVTTRGGMRVLPDATIAEHLPVDLLIVPGGPGVRTAIQHDSIIEWMAQVQPSIALASVCTGALLLAEAKRLDGQRATTHYASYDWLEQYKRVTVLRGERFVDNNTILTSAGVSAGIDMSLHLVERLLGKDIARWTAERMEYQSHNT
ncbi:MAG: DJ-1/PfpI family protein [Chloroflexi bacterium AL-W]|nr:DJ-1/PfpI family protein [Chloroflexi bacterium AL-N1]NOK66926.1 DJ-1/PfpI family protein [Chloroflexi bacterium AL-N10]NOK74782.1 DJ-1/PfpI family protein [Chloroflexi bacterium AL-N5]NOK81528.1 DJ-1/PfpI family protein [Chloroflexi bacterium AL-W]NOK88998.1 DJ-1/PfpI family protein [Chloroflexi bacterium AL-N15]